MEYFGQYLSIGYLESAAPSHGDKNSGEGGFSYTDSTARVASASICGLTNSEADERYWRKSFIVKRPR